MIIIGFLILLAAVGIGVSGVATNWGGDHLLDQDFSVLGLHLSDLSTGQLFTYGIVVGVAGMLGLSMLLGIFNRRMASRRSRRELKGSRRETDALRTDRDRLTQQLDDEQTERTRRDAERKRGSSPPRSPTS